MIFFTKNLNKKNICFVDIFSVGVWGTRVSDFLLQRIQI